MLRVTRENWPRTRPRSSERSSGSASAGGQIFDSDCLLAQEVHGTTDCLFQIHALNGRHQVVLSESMTLLPPMPVYVYDDPTESPRCTRLQVVSCTTKRAPSAHAMCLGGRGPEHGRGADLAVARWGVAVPVANALLRFRPAVARCAKAGRRHSAQACARGCYLRLNPQPHRRPGQRLHSHHHCARCMVCAATSLIWASLSAVR